MEQKPKLTFGEINYKNIEIFKIITQKTLPVTYSDKFYHRILTYQDFSALGYYNDIAVGAITARIEDQDNIKTAYIMTFGVLDAYRRLGFGSQLLNELINRIKSYKEVKRIYLHMWSNNDVGFQFYSSQGFEKTKFMKNYYTDIEPPHCYILTKRLYPDEDPPIQYTEEDAETEKTQREE
ncbi:unnamed protein product [Paramecium primaurelia]|uniref:N-acetyltransferase domain-containing protein n=1 Tax=Paramecium primaurelia TaxID=5886 RepID=A0A8S1JWI4_PARPR|nr:unnamed protein product [Paramecium primaurelia]